MEAAAPSAAPATITESISVALTSTTSAAIATTTTVATTVATTTATETTTAPATPAVETATAPVAHETETSAVPAVAGVSVPVPTPAPAAPVAAGAEAEKTEKVAPMQLEENPPAAVPNKGAEAPATPPAPAAAPVVVPSDDAAALNALMAVAEPFGLPPMSPSTPMAPKPANEPGAATAATPQAGRHRRHHHHHHRHHRMQPLALGTAASGADQSGEQKPAEGAAAEGQRSHRHHHHHHHRHHGERPTPVAHLREALALAADQQQQQQDKPDDKVAEETLENGDRLRRSTRKRVTRVAAIQDEEPSPPVHRRAAATPHPASVRKRRAVRHRGDSEGLEEILEGGTEKDSTTDGLAPHVRTLQQLDGFLTQLKSLSAAAAAAPGQPPQNAPQPMLGGILPDVMGPAPTPEAAMRAISDLLGTPQPGPAPIGLSGLPLIGELLRNQAIKSDALPTGLALPNLEATMQLLDLSIIQQMTGSTLPAPPTNQLAEFLNTLLTAYGKDPATPNISTARLNAQSHLLAALGQKTNEMPVPAPQSTAHPLPPQLATHNPPTLPFMFFARNPQLGHDMARAYRGRRATRHVCIAYDIYYHHMGLTNPDPTLEARVVREQIARQRQEKQRLHLQQLHQQEQQAQAAQMRNSVKFSLNRPAPPPVIQAPSAVSVPVSAPLRAPAPSPVPVPTPSPLPGPAPSPPPFTMGRIMPLPRTPIPFPPSPAGLVRPVPSPSPPPLRPTFPAIPIGSPTPAKPMASAPVPSPLMGVRPGAVPLPPIPGRPLTFPAPPPGGWPIVPLVPQGTPPQTGAQPGQPRAAASGVPTPQNLLPTPWFSIPRQ
ncbi:hypothetical protein PAPYR_2242 [Paratrimastix pyriformis]|uniref:Uncharacterized protein n=1 Tax=Paratrimastix pyriformis TaxID=342808 RepID=A0ABQ8UPX3_9EUKA|nr:hypothetical protein PAPYR_2242 [Paratrimastix pyriformis]